MRKDIKHIIISGGGTGGHVFPAISIANALKEIEPGIEILFVGAKGRMEMEKVPKAGYDIKGLPIMGIQRKLTLKNLQVPFKLIKSLRQAKQIIKSFKPDVVVGVGGEGMPGFTGIVALVAVVAAAVLVARKHR